VGIPLKLNAYSGGDEEGYDPRGSLIMDANGNLYGTTFTGGAHGLGTVYELSPSTPWTMTWLYSFAGGLFDGAAPFGSLVMDAHGNLYGTTSGGGAHGYGFVFELFAGNSWTESLIHTFTGGTDGENPYASLVFDSDGDLYGTTETGGAQNGGVVFKLSSALSWAETVLHSFGATGDGSTPFIGDLIIGPRGGLYGTTYLGGTHNVGTVFKVVP
jgi:uncharacterized repeat protein (TIGR03803 family)